MRVLILGGTTEASDAGATAGRRRAIRGRPCRWPAAPKTRRPQPIACRVGGFGGIDGLVDYLRPSRSRADRRHPSVRRPDERARDRGRRGARGMPLLVVLRPRPGARGRATAGSMVDDLAAAAAALGAAPRRVLLTVGQQTRAVRRPPAARLSGPLVDPPRRAAAAGRGSDHRARAVHRRRTSARLLTEHRIEMMVTKNSGGDCDPAKIEAARALGLPVVMVARPPPPAGARRSDRGRGVALARSCATLRGGV